MKLNVRAFEAHLYLGTAYAAPVEARRRPWASSTPRPSSTPSSPRRISRRRRSSRRRATTARPSSGATRACSSSRDRSYGHYTLGVIHQRAGAVAGGGGGFRTGRRAEWRGPARTREPGVVVDAPWRPRGRRGRSSSICSQLGYQVAPSHFNLGVIAARRGDQAEAARRYQPRARTPTPRSNRRVMRWRR